MKLLTFGGSNSSQSINKQLAHWAANQIKNSTVHLIDLNDFEMPLYSIDREKKDGIHSLALDFKKLIEESDGIVLSLAEHNGSYAVAFKNIFDWVSRLGGDLWEHKPMFLLTTAPGGRGGASVMETAKSKFERMNKTPLTTFSLPHFYDRFEEEVGITESESLKEFTKQALQFEEILNSIG